MHKSILIAFALSASMNGTSTAQVIISGEGPARECYLKTKGDDPGRKSTIRDCIDSLRVMSLSRNNRAALKTNIGILYMRGGDYETAQKWYEEALDLNPDIAETHISYAASQIYRGDPDGAIASINTALELGTDKRPEALYNRAIAYDRKQDYSRAYKDLQRALTLRPDWDLALKALDNYDVKPASKTN